MVINEQAETEPVEAKEVQAGTLARRTLVTVVILTAYAQLGRWLTIPGVDSAAMDDLFRNFGSTPYTERFEKIEIFGLGITPFLTGFLLTEIFAVLVPAGRRLREGGVAGRVRLNALAFRISLLVLVLQASGVCSFLSSVQSPAGLPILLPGAGNFLLGTLTLVAGGIGSFLLAESISRWGVGNGFCWFVLLFPLLYFLDVLSESMSAVAQPSAMPLSLGAPTVLMIMALAAVFMIRSRHFEVEGAEGMTSSLRLPPLPQGVGPILLAVALVGFLELEVGLWIGVQAVGICAFSVLGYQFFSSRQRIDENLEPLARVTQEGASASVRQTLKAAAFLMAITLVLALDAAYSFDGLGTRLRAAHLLMIVAFALDLVSEAKFHLRHADPIPVMELDNPHLAAFLQAELEQRSIPSEIRAQQYRQLFFFFQPLVKMHLMVPATHEPEVRRILEETEVRTP